MNNDPSTRGDPDTELQAAGLSHAVRDRVLFYDLSFRLVAGQVLHVTGANGSGKTTLLRILTGLTRPDEGQIRWRGEDIFIERYNYLADLAFVGHAHGVKDDATPIESLRVTASLGQGNARMTPHQALERMELNDYADVPCRTLSAGQRRRLALARLCVSYATLWILDEPFTGIDPSGIELVQTLIVEHVQSGGAAIVTSHQPLSLDGLAVQSLSLE